MLFTPRLGGQHAGSRDAVEAVLSPFPAAKPNTDLTAKVAQILKGGNHPVAPGAAILYAARQRRHAARGRSRGRHLADGAG